MDGAEVVPMCRDFALACGELRALAALIERPPLDDVLLARDVSLRIAAAIKIVLVHAAPFEAGNDEVEAICRLLAKVDGLDWDEACPYESSGAEEIGDVACCSGTCVAAHYEDHDPDHARSRYREQAKAISARYVAAMAGAATDG